ncbi:MAG: DNA repair protein RecN [Pseudanabaena sp. M158S2SP1A06QC]|jgi:DNA repair protein RecN (Recombination protein N)|nr:DNA repair protein RecN [Pseudanabaena sp. M53BS1SP1A06MG]MCA6584403.1 DNA repair protein RecN [Pseudanabaena sp. M34BS1SP1A06MG]MCA6594480.1 DNA repair protein RecN [Pseudanabaena sp. M38BS1SP1A06MG]MCA6597426.1 DNA repair protein RecN [Pseudanabaena sp. M046S1SP1A06QC]MCA6601192.1 DNA repair protein RecN [Pseudanabaena sp. M57BS1SP1A06MG]MCA6611555.1 DNA repair protein RecN [Pseudanabaena sp. M158S2SP1A06QC]
MLLSLKIENFALIDRLELDLYAGLNILTGETGAGKSIVLDALDAALGGKVSARVIRSGADRANIEATFSINQVIAQWLESQEIDAIDAETLICSREITVKSNRTRVNGVVVNKQQIQELRDHLVEITAQGQTILLSQSAQQRELLDSFGDQAFNQAISLQRHKVAKLFEIKERSRKALFERQQNERNRLQQLDMLRYQLKELTAANIEDPDELDHLESDRNRLAHSVELQKQGYAVYEALYQNDSGSACADLLGQAESILTEMITFDREVEGILELVSSALAQVEEAGRQINNYANHLDSEPEQLESIEQRINQIKQICRKYGTLPEAIAYMEKLQNELTELTDQSVSLEDLERKAEADLQSLLKACKKLTELRRQTAIALEKAQIEVLKMLAMEKVRFQVGLYPVEPTALGSDRIEFEFSPNLGEPLQPLAETASGGEMSRFLLALKTCFVQQKTQQEILTNVESSHAKVGTMVFDEIDTGVSGRVAQAIATQLWQLSRSSQILCVTHQPLIAAIADRHFHVSKNVVGDRTKIQIRLLELEARKQELAQIASGKSIDQGKRKKEKGKDMLQGKEDIALSQAIAFAESLLEQAAAIKTQS